MAPILRLLSILDCFVLLAGIAAAQAPSSPVTFREGGGGGTTDTLCRAVQAALDADPQAGAAIQSATLRLWCTDLMIPTTSARTIRATPVIDFGMLGTWHEPAATGPGTGVNWLRRDARPDAAIGWTGQPNAALEDSVAGPPSNASISAALPGIQSTITVGGGGPNQAQSWHAFDLTLAVSLWAQGLSNQGVMLEQETATGTWVTATYASDEAADPARRPQLAVTFTLPSPLQPWNRIPRLQASWPAAPATPMDCDLFLVLAAVDDDGTPPSYRVLKRPSHGTLLGSFPFVTYRPEAGFSGTDTFSWAAHDAWGMSFPQTVTVTVVPTAGTQGLVFQQDVAPSQNLSAGATMASGVGVDPWTAGTTYEETVLRLYAGQRQALLRFPDLIGTAPGRIPPGSQILDARLDLQSAWVSAPAEPGGGRSVSLARLIDPLHHGSSWSWREPAALTSTSLTVEAGCTGCGVTFRHPDATAANAPVWAFVEGTTIEQQLALGGDVDPTDVASFRIAAGDTAPSVWRSADVTASVRAWAAGEPNLGWLLRSSDASIIQFWSDDASPASVRPRLSVSFRPPSAGTLTSAAAPHADGGPDRSCFTGQTVSLDARRSFHPNGLPLTPVWIQTGGPPVALANASTLTPDFTAPAPVTGTRTTRHFVRAEPPPALVDGLAAVIRSEGWHLGATLSTLLRSNAMFSAAARKAIVKTPVELAAGIARTLRIPLQTGDIVGSWDSLAEQLQRAQHVVSDPLDVAGFPKDVAWLDGFGMLRRSEIARHLLLRARTPTSPAATTPCSGAGPNPVTTACGQHPHAVTGLYPWVAPVAVDLAPFLPPSRARRSAETLDLMSDLLDVALQAAPGSSGSSERQRCLEYLDTLAVWNGAGAPPLFVARPFDGDDPDPSQQLKIWGLLMLLLEHPDSVRL